MSHSHLLAYVRQGTEAAQAPGTAISAPHQGHHDARDMCAAKQRQVQRDRDGTADRQERRFVSLCAPAKNKTPGEAQPARCVCFSSITCVLGLILKKRCMVVSAQDVL